MTAVQDFPTARLAVGYVLALVALYVIGASAWAAILAWPTSWVVLLTHDAWPHWMTVFIAGSWAGNLAVIVFSAVVNVLPVYAIFRLFRGL